jgi:hypothetical protein
MSIMTQVQPSEPYDGGCTYAGGSPAPDPDLLTCLTVAFEDGVDDVGDVSFGTGMS